MAEYNYFRKTKRYNGKQYVATGKTELEAMTKLAEKIAQVKRGEEEISDSMTVSAWYKMWLETYKQPKGLTPKSLGMYDEKFNKYIKPRIGSMKLKDVKETHLQRILNEQEGMSFSHCTKVRAVLQQLFKRARQSRLIIHDPAELLELPRNKKGSHRSITDEERKAILAVAEYSRSGLWILTLLYTGMRPGEAAALTWGDVNFKTNEIFVHAARESGKTEAIKGPKTTAGVRIIPIHAKLAPKLRAAKGKSRAKDFVFTTQQGNRHNENSIRRLWTGFERELNIYLGAELYRNEVVKPKVAEDLTPYCLRHTFCTDLQKAGVPINVAKELMGHADIQTTANIYTHKDTKTAHKSMALLDGTARVKSETTDEKTDEK